MAIDFRMVDKLYKAYSYVTKFMDLGEACLEWVYHLRQAPIAPYEHLIRGYNDLPHKSWAFARGRVDEMFTGEEATALLAHLEQVHKIDGFTIEKPLPIDIVDMVDPRVASGDSWVPGSILMFSNLPGCNLPFEVWAYYDLRRPPFTNDKELLEVAGRGRKRIEAVAREMFEALPGLMTGLHGYVLDCGCVAVRQKFPDGSLNREIRIHHDPDRNPCDLCMGMTASWENRIIDEVVIYNSKFQVG